MGDRRAVYQRVAYRITLAAHLSLQCAGQRGEAPGQIGDLESPDIGPHGGESVEQKVQAGAAPEQTQLEPFSLNP